MSPAANAPTIGASSIALASQESRKQKDSPAASKTPLVRSRDAREKQLRREGGPERQRARQEQDRLRQRPQGSVPTVNALPRSAATISPVTAERMTSPMTSSITAAPKITRASLLWERPRSLKTRAVMPTLRRA